MGAEDTNGEDVGGAEAKVLPAREALSLISTDPLSAYGVEEMAGADPAGGSTAADQATSRLPDTDAAASGGGEESVTSENRSEHVNRTDSASSET